MLKKYNVAEFEKMSGLDVENVSLKKGVVYVYVNTAEECPFVGCEYEDGTCSVVGAHMDRICNFKDMINAMFSI